MTRVLENGQLEWTFEDLDFVGALDQLLFEVKELSDYADGLSWGSDYLSVSGRIADLTKVCLYLERLNRGQNYV